MNLTKLNEVQDEIIFPLVTGSVENVNSFYERIKKILESDIFKNIRDKTSIHIDEDFVIIKFTEISYASVFNIIFSLGFNCCNMQYEKIFKKEDENTLFLNKFLKELCNIFEAVDGDYLSHFNIDINLEILSYFDIEFLKSLDIAEISGTLVLNFGAIKKFNDFEKLNDFNLQPITLLLFHLAIYYPHRLTNNEFIDPDYIKPIFHHLGISTESYF